MNRKLANFFYLVLVIIVGFSLPASAATVNVKDYGAIGDGTTDDTAAIKRAIAAARPGKLGVVLFPPGSYLFSQDVIVNTTLKSEQRARRATLIAAEGAVRLQLRGFGTLRDLNFDSRSPQPLWAAVDVFAGDFAITNCNFSNRFWTSMSLVRSFKGLIEDNKIAIADANNTPGGIKVLPQSDSITIRHNQVTGPATFTKFIEGISVQGARGVVVRDNTVKNFSNGIRFTEGAQLDMVENTVSNCTTGLFLDRPTNVLLQKNFVKGPGAAKSGTSCVRIKGSRDVGAVENTTENAAAGFLMFDSTDIRVSDNQVSKVGAGVDATNCYGSAVNRNTISSSGTAIFANRLANSEVVQNLISGAQQQGIRFIVLNGRYTINNNVLRDCGLSAFGDPSDGAVILIRGNAFTGRVTNNTYSGNTKNLKFFISSDQRGVVQGNTTSTGLPNSVP